MGTAAGLWGGGGGVGDKLRINRVKVNVNVQN